MSLIRRHLLLAIIICFILSCVGCIHKRVRVIGLAVMEYYTCARCGSIQKTFSDKGVVKSREMVHMSVGYAHCSHDWQVGLNVDAGPHATRGRVILLKKGNTYGAFIPKRYTHQSTRLQYVWYYRTDGKGTFKPSERSHFITGTSSSTPEYYYGVKRNGISTWQKVKFGPFVVDWAPDCVGDGWPQFNTDIEPGKQVPSDAIRICATSVRDIKQIDALDSKWLYRASPTDTGFRPPKR